MSSGAQKCARAALAASLALLVLLFGEWIAGFVDGRDSLRELHARRPGAPWLYDLVPGAVAHGTTAEIEYRIGAHGFRDRDRAREKERGVFRIAVLGDSVAFGYGVSQSDGFVARLETLLSAADPGVGGANRVEVLNFGVSGYNPYNEAELFRGVVRGFRPDLTLVQFCSNDLNDPRYHFGASTAERLGELPDLAFPDLERARATPMRVSRLASACDRSNLCRALLGPLLGTPNVPHDREEFIETFEDRTDPQFEKEWAWLEARYAEIARAAREVGSRFGVLVFPSAADLGDGAGRSGASEAFRRIGREKGWEIIDLGSAFTGSGSTPDALLLDPWHPTALGHAIAADEIARALRERQLMEGPS